MDLQAALIGVPGGRAVADERQRTLERAFHADYTLVVAVAYQLLRDHSEAEDVAQEAFLLFHERRRADGEQARPWLCRTASNIALTRLRSRRRREHRELRHARTGEERSIDPTEVLEAHERRRLVRAALRRIAPKKARVLCLRYSGLSYREVAEALGVGVDQVGTMLHRAEAALERELDRAALQ